LKHDASDAANGPFVYSYSMTSCEQDPQASGYYSGITSVFYGSPMNPSTRFYSKLANVRNPVRKIMVAEEQANTTPAEAAQPNSGSVLNDGRFTIIGTGGLGALPADGITIRHNKKGDVTFADGHVEAVAPAFWQEKDASGNFVNLQPNIQ
jgi:prepilin-type processing-associated H-X9-DG protein